MVILPALLVAVLAVTLVKAPWSPKKLRAAVYLRRSEGESGSTQAQLDRILPLIEELEKKGAIYKVDRRVVGRDIAKKRRFNARTDLALPGDIHNEGEGASGFSVDNRPVMQGLFQRLEKDEYDVVLTETLDRLGRDYAELAFFALPMWREKGKTFFSLTDGDYLSDDPLTEAVINTKLTWGGIAKKGEIKKAEKGRVGGAIDRGFFKSSSPEFLGTKGKQHGLNYRKAWALMQAYGEKPNGNVNNASAIAKEFGKDNKWALSWYKRLKAYDELGALEGWLTAYEAINAFTEALGGYPRNQWRSNPMLKRIVKASSGFFGYPAGVNVAGTDEFVTFPNPVMVGLDALASVDDPQELEAFMVERRILTAEEKENLHPFQTQQRTRKK